MIEKTYQPDRIENDIYRDWEQAGAFAAGAGAKEGAEPFTIVIPPPNVTGSLHIGHALNNTLQDILSRHARMKGKNVLWQPGMDHAGIATQMVVERQLAETQQPDRHAMGREAFIERVWNWKSESGGEILNQLRRLGASCDWSRTRFTMGQPNQENDQMVEAVIKVFVELYDKGLIYRDQRLVNWDPQFQTAISDLEVETRDTAGAMWSFAYPLVDGPVDGISEIVISTTRPETMLGDGAVAVHPEDERYKNLIGKMVRLPIAERHIPIIADEYPDPEFGTGAVKITGAHDFNDFEVARRNNIPLIKLMDARAAMISTPENNVPERYAGKDRFEARKMVLSEIEELGFYRGKEERVIPQPFGDRSNVVIEPMLTDQWYVDAETLAKPAIASVKEGRTQFVPQNWENTYFAWMENIRPWCISRQLWWGHQIPAWYSADGTVFVAKTEAEAQAKADAHYGESTPITRDSDVLDTWFSSALWPFSTMGWPNDTEELRTYFPTHTLTTGFDIIFFWVARMMMMSLEFMGTEPFKKVYVHALVRDEKGQKMSKSKGNVVDPLELVDEYGADATRFTLTAMAAQGRDLKLSMPRVEGYRNFVTKLWNAARFLEMNECVRQEDFNPATVEQPLNKWILGSTAAAAAAIEKGIVDYRFNDAANAAYDFVWGTFCDWYVELSKPILQGENESLKAETRATAAFALDQILKILHPIMPFVTEQLWAETAANGPKRTQLLMLTPWPELDGLRDEQSEAEINWLIELISGIRSVRSEMNVPASAKIPLKIIGADDETQERVANNLPAILRLARISDSEHLDAVPEGSAQMILNEATFALPLGDVIDLAAEKARLGKDIDKLQKEITQIEKKLSNEQFLSKAPEDVVAVQRERVAGIIEKRDRVAGALARLS